MGKKIMNTVLFLVVLGGCVAMTLLTGNGSSGTMIYNFAFLAVMAVIYLAGLFGGMFRVDSIGEALARGTQELSSIFKIPGKAKSEDLSCLKGMFEHKYLDDRMDSFVDAMEKNQEGIGDVEDYINEDEIDLHVHKKILEMAPDIFTSLGILGTFIGLVWGLKNFQPVAEFAQGAMESGTYKGIAKTKYVNDKQITDHYAIIPTGQGFGALRSLAPTALKVYEIICRRFLSIFYPAAEYQKVAMTLSKNGEKLFANFKYLINDGYLKVAANSFSKKKDDVKYSPEFIARLAKIKKGDKLSVQGIDIKEGETSPPKRYNSGSLILTMENAGQFIEDEALREQIKGAGIGTSATRDGIITKLEKNKYISLNKKTQIVTPTFLGEIIYDIVYYSINGLLRADLTASWEKGLEGVAEGQISKQEYTDKMTTFVTKYTNLVKQIQNQNGITGVFDKTKVFYAKGGGAQKKETRATARTGAKAEKNADTQ